MSKLSEIGFKVVVLVTLGSVWLAIRGLADHVAWLTIEVDRCGVVSEPQPSPMLAPKVKVDPEPVTSGENTNM